MKINLELEDAEPIVNYADEKEVFKTVKQIHWHLKQIESKDYKISHLDLDDLKEAEDLLDNVVPYYSMEE